MPRQSPRKKPAFCPFCKAPIQKPKKIDTTPRREFPGGRCGCGAVFVSDLTGKNGGEAMIESVSLVCNDDLEKAWSLEEKEDYTLKVMSYDAYTHSFNKDGYYKDGMARIYFVKLLK
jgi:hypothetical protein